MKASIRLTEMAEPAGMSTSSTTAILPSIGTAADGSRLSRPQGAQGTFCPGVSLNYNPSLTAPGFFITDAGCCRLGPGVGIFESGLLGIQPLLSWWRPRLPFGKLPSSSFKQDSRKCQSSCVVFSLGGPKLDQFDGIWIFCKVRQGIQTAESFIIMQILSRRLFLTGSWLLCLQSWSVFKPGSSAPPATLWATLWPLIFLYCRYCCFCCCRFIYVDHSWLQLF